MHILRSGLAATLALAASLAGAATLSGNLGDSGNGALVGSDLGAPGFSDDNAIADNVALHAFTVTVGGPVSIVSTGFAGGGVDPYFTLFSGSGSAATFVDSNYAQATSTGGDFTWTGALAAGSYEIALGAFENLSFAENLGSGTLGDGFIALGDPNSLGDGSYALTLTTPVPEPTAAWLLAIGLAAIATRAWRGRRG
ncbi:MAG: DVUA0089 family protein [Burkholderiales bacterium]|nr:DVUA0089 family protein [Burkholderiales bacterium]